MWFKKKKPRVLILGLDGTPLSFIKKKIEEGRLPGFKEVFGKGSVIEIKSVHPTVSCVAWSTFMTGRNPAKHNIFGFIDRKPGSYSIYIPNSSNMTSETLWEYLSKKGKKVLVIGVPVTYPPRKVNGILVSGFLAPKVEGATYPPQVAQRLKKGGYEIDIDPWRARENLDNLYPDLVRVFQARTRNFLDLYKDDSWDFAIVHFMETDRLHHFMWEHMETGRQPYATQFMKVYEAIDQFVLDVERQVDQSTTLVIMSDHGFCTLKKEVYINYFLEQAGYLKCKENAKSLSDIIPGETRAFCLDPGRIYINLRGREAGGIVSKEDYENLCSELQKSLLDLKDSEGNKVIKEVIRREEVYEGPNFEYAPDLIVNPIDGYDPKGAFGKKELTGKGPIVGMHTYHDAMLYVRGKDLRQDSASIVDVTTTVLDIMEVEPPGDLDGKSLLV